MKEVTDISLIDMKWLLGNDTDDPLRYAFDAKRVVHPRVKGEGKPIPKDAWQATWSRLMDQESKNKKRVAYIHIPFCQTRCLYCGFFQNFSNKELEDGYIDRLTSELRRDSQSLCVKSNPIHAVYIGGGTPSVLSPKNIERLLETIHNTLPLANDYEMTFESRVHEFDNEKIQMCIDGGVNRFSFGVQSFDTKVRRNVGRKDDGEKVMERLKYIHSLDNAAISIDLMYGLPEQTMEVWEKDVQTLIESGIDGGDLYQLNIYDDSKLKEVIEKGSLQPAAKTCEQAIMFKKGVEMMGAGRMRRLSIDHWGRNTRERNIYNDLVKSGAVMLPFGAGAGGKLNGYTMFVDKDIKSYMTAIDVGEKPIMFMMSMPEGHELYSDIIGQMDKGYLNVKEIKAKFGIDLEDLLSPILNVWAARGLVEIRGDYLDLTTAGQFWYVNLTQAILDWIVMSKKGNDCSMTVKAIAAQG